MRKIEKVSGGGGILIKPSIKLDAYDWIHTQAPIHTFQIARPHLQLSGHPSQLH